MKTSASEKLSAWQAALINAVVDPAELLALLELDKNLLDKAYAAAKLFPLKVPRGFIARMQKGNLHDPLLRQILPLADELIEVTGYEKDPLNEKNTNPLPGLLHKYRGRVLVTLVSACAVNCRFCFRRHFPYDKNNPGMSGHEKIFSYIAADHTISEVILSGGDPLMAGDQILKNFTDRLQTIPHVKRVRIHSRIPIVLPERITQNFLDWVKHAKQKIILVTHCNHPQEINAEVQEAIQMLAANGVVLLNQSVLLKSVNDCADTLIHLSEKLFSIGIQPYYLHALDRVQGTTHFDIPHSTAKQLHAEMNEHLPGYLVPKLVYEKPGAPAKIILI